MTTRSLHHIAFAGLAWLAGCGGKSHAGLDAAAGGQSSTSSGASSGGAPAGEGGRGARPAGHAGAAGATSGGTLGSGQGGGMSGGGSSGGSTGQGGVQDAGGAGVGSGGDTDLGAVVAAACSNVCKKFDRTSAGNSCEDFGSLGSTCQTDCTGTFVAPSGACANEGLEMLACLAQTLPSAELDDCWIQFYDVVQQCYMAVDAYEACLTTMGASLPDSLCAKITGVLSADPELNRPASCQEDRKCLSHDVYAVRCEQTPEGQSSCTCQRAGAAPIVFIWPTSVAAACRESLPGCRSMEPEP